MDHGSPERRQPSLKRNAMQIKLYGEMLPPSTLLCWFAKRAHALSGGDGGLSCCGDGPSVYALSTSSDLIWSAGKLQLLAYYKTIASSTQKIRIRLLDHLCVSVSSVRTQSGPWADVAAGSCPRRNAKSPISASRDQQATMARALVPHL